MQRCRPQRRRSNVFDRFINQTLSQGGDTSPLSARACGLHGKAVFKENVLEKIDKLFEEILYFRIKSYDGDMCIYNPRSTWAFNASPVFQFVHANHKSNSKIWPSCYLQIPMCKY